MTSDSSEYVVLLRTSQLVIKTLFEEFTRMSEADLVDDFQIIHAGEEGMDKIRSLMEKRRKVRP